ncbi:MAG: sensor histidine kinase [Acidimicrobiales bacterium]
MTTSPVPDLDGGPVSDVSPEVAGDRRALYGNLRRQLPLFAAGGALSILAALVPFPHARTAEVLVAGTLFLGLTAAAVILPWPRLPLWLWPSLPVGYIAVVALLRDAQGGANTGFAVIYVLPVVWVAYYGRALHLIAALAAAAAALIVPLIVVGSPAYPPSQWRLVVVIVVGSTLISFTFLAALNRERRLLVDVARQSHLTRLGARQAEAAREQLASLLRAATSTAVIGVDDHGTVTFFSVGAERMFGVASHDVVGSTSFFDFLDPAELVRRPFPFPSDGSNAGGGTDIPDDVVWSFVGPNRDRRRMTATVTPQPQGAAQPHGYVIVASDVTEREELARERDRLLAIQGEAAEVLVQQNTQLKELTTMKDDLVATVSHELRTPLTSILGFAELLMEDDRSGQIDLSEDQLRMLRAIDRNSRQLLHVASELLDDPGLGNGRGVRFVQTGLTSLATDAVEAMRTATAGSHVEISLVRGVATSSSGVDEITINCDQPRLHQLLANLLSNAVKFSDPGGHVQLRLTPLGPFVRIDVSDDGPGIPEDERHHLFDRFHRLASASHKGIPGTGLGLAIAKSVVDAHSGTIEIVDVPGWSTTFRIHLPVRSPTSEGHPHLLDHPK